MKLALVLLALPLALASAAAVFQGQSNDIKDQEEILPSSVVLEDQIYDSGIGMVQAPTTLKRKLASDDEDYSADMEPIVVAYAKSAKSIKVAKASGASSKAAKADGASAKVAKASGASSKAAKADGASTKVAKASGASSKASKAAKASKADTKSGVSGKKGKKDSYSSDDREKLIKPPTSFGWFLKYTIRDGRDDEFGYSLELSGPGNHLVAGTRWGGSNRTGEVRLYVRNEDTDEWQRRGPSIFGDGNLDQLGYSVSVSDSGMYFYCPTPCFLA
jgi:hypothetical protein